MTGSLTLAILNLGGTEIVLVIVLFVLFFGVDRIPEIARTVGRVQAQWNRARKEIEGELRTPEEKANASLRDFERRRERQMRENDPVLQEEQRLREAARVLGIPGSDTMDIPRLRKEIAARTGVDADSSGA